MKHSYILDLIKNLAQSDRVLSLSDILNNTKAVPQTNKKMCSILTIEINHPKIRQQKCKNLLFFKLDFHIEKHIYISSVCLKLFKFYVNIYENTHETI